jgi:hypothetical protein
MNLTIDVKLILKALASRITKFRSYNDESPVLTAMFNAIKLVYLLFLLSIPGAVIYVTWKYFTA